MIKCVTKQSKFKGKSNKNILNMINKILKKWKHLKALKYVDRKLLLKNFYWRLCLNSVLHKLLKRKTGSSFIHATFHCPKKC